LARKYFRQAAAFLPVNDPMYAFSDTFDYRSLMLYDSFTARNHASGGWPILALDGPGRMILTGGVADVNRAGPSQGDIGRVMRLYPPPGNAQQPPPPPPAPPAAGRPGRRSVAANTTQTTEPWLEVEFCDGFTTTVGPVPTEAPISPDSPRALELAKEYDADMQGAHFTEDVLM